nr:PREDICTED: WD repeat-containing protein 76 isoform X2 [Lepisosteus oculatus]
MPTAVRSVAEQSKFNSGCIPYVKLQRMKERHSSSDEPAASRSRSRSDSECSSDSEWEGPVTPGKLSSYELKRLQNIKQNQAFLSSLNITETAQALKAKPAQRGLKTKRKKSSPEELQPVRKSMRLQRLDPVGAALPEQAKASVPAETWRPPPKEGPIAMEPANLLEGGGLPSGLVRLWNEPIALETKQKLDLKQYKSVLESMTLNEERVVKAVKHRVFSMAVHPSTSRLLIASGDKSGHVGLWALGSDLGDDGVLLFEPHSSPVCCMAFSTTQPAHLLSASYDCSLRAADISRAVFDEVYVPDKSLSSFDFLNEDCSSLVVGQWEGNVAVVDRRTPGTSHESLFALDTRSLQTVHVHPVKKQYFVTAGKGNVSIYDVRYLKKSKTSCAVSSLSGHNLSVNSAYFSPNTGHRVLTSCLDNTIRVFDTASLSGDAPLLQFVRHNMHTGRWLTKLRAVWDPKQEDCFAVGSMQYPRRIEVLQESGRRVHTFQEPQCLTTICSVTVFHPHRNALAGGNASGRVHVFLD